MAGLRAIKRRITTVKNTRKITRALKMVAAARLRRAQQRITDLRPYAIKTENMLASVAARVDGESHPLLVRRPEQRVLLVVLTSDRGLAGGFNANVSKRALKMWKQMEAEGKTVTFATIGKKGGEFLRRRGGKLEKVFQGIFENLNIAKAGEVGRYIVDRYAGDHIDAAYFIYNEFKSAITQEVSAEQLLPVRLAKLPEGGGSDYLYEPSKEALLERLMPMYMEIQSFRALLESVASEHGARMTAMDNATRNASDTIDKLTLQYNRARQAAITKELMEIIGGAEALKG
jgi:F-type H+-transporting ATPase subunit gamma